MKWPHQWSLLLNQVLDLPSSVYRNRTTTFHVLQEYKQFTVRCKCVVLLNVSCQWAWWVALVVKNPPASAGDIRDAGLIPGSGRSPGGRHGDSLQYSFLENPMDRGAWWATMHRIAKTQTWLKRLSTRVLHTWEKPGRAKDALRVEAVGDTTPWLCINVQLDFLKQMNLFLFCFWLHWVFVAVRKLFLVAGSGGCRHFSLWKLLVGARSLECMGVHNCDMWV